MPHSLSALAREAGVSATVLKTEFADVYGETVFAFLRSIRLERARTGIEREGGSVSEAAAAVGYGYASNFSALFRRHFGHAPTVICQKSVGL